MTVHITITKRGKEYEVRAASMDFSYDFCVGKRSLSPFLTWLRKHSPIAYGHVRDLLG